MVKERYERQSGGKHRDDVRLRVRQIDHDENLGIDSARVGSERYLPRCETNTRGKRGIPAHTLDWLLIQLLAAVIGAALVALSILLTYRYAERFARRIGRERMNVVLRLSAFIVLSIGVQVAWTGIKELLREIGIPA